MDSGGTKTWAKAGIKIGVKRRIKGGRNPLMLKRGEIPLPFSKEGWDGF